MKYRKFGLSIIAITSLLSMAFTTNASLISFNGQSVNTLDLNGSAASFEDFYNYSGASANTGLEIVDTIVMFAAELNGDLGIFTIANKSKSGGSNGKLDVTISATSGAVLFTDDPSEFPSSTQMSFSWGGNLTDGYIFSGLDINDFMFSQTLSSKKGINGLQFIDFTDGSLNSAEYSSLLTLDSPFTLSNNMTAVPTPATALLFLIGLIAIRRHTK